MSTYEEAFVDHRRGCGTGCHRGARRIAGGSAALDHIFVIVLENHNSYTSFGSQRILDSTSAPHLQALAKTYNVATNYNGIWHPSLSNYVAMITGDFIGTDVIAS